ncbi:MAG TPA: PDDEXK nuclease domain-containing protein [Burkholderiales bacterium]|nr:PDDEXK nuclease domain-containing protein [Burkholderiales bacterium]
MTELIIQDYLQLLDAIKERIRQAQYQSLRVVNQQMITMYWQIGETLSLQVVNSWGKSVVETLSRDLCSEYPEIKGFSPRNLWLMKQFYEEYYTSQKLQQLVAEIPWGQNLLIMAKIKDPLAREYYLTKCRDNGWSRGVLAEEIQFSSYEKSLQFQHNFDSTLPASKLADYRLQFKDEYNLSFLNLEVEHSEKQLENAIVANIVKVLGQFGKDFAFMGRQFKLEVGEHEYRVDLLFYHRKLRSLIAIELKITDFKPEYSQQLNWYLHLLDKQVKYSEDNPSIGILICKSKDNLLVEYALELANNPMGVATYHYRNLPQEIAQYLPNEEDVKKLLEMNNLESESNDE